MRQSSNPRQEHSPFLAPPYLTAEEQPALLAPPEVTFEEQSALLAPPYLTAEEQPALLTPAYLTAEEQSALLAPPEVTLARGTGFGRSAKLMAPLAVMALSAVALLTGCNGRTILTDDIEKPRKPMFGEVRVWFVHERNGSLDLVPVVRRVRTKNAVRESMTELLAGPTAQEEQTGLASEIPRGTILIDVHETADDVDINLSHRFATGGGTSLETRLDQLRRTVEESAGKRKVYLDVEGKRLTATGGEGLEIKQPINM